MSTLFMFLGLFKSKNTNWFYATAGAKAREQMQIIPMSHMFCSRSGPIRIRFLHHNQQWSLRVQIVLSSATLRTAFVALATTQMSQIWLNLVNISILIADKQFLNVFFIELSSLFCLQRFQNTALEGADISLRMRLPRFGSALIAIRSVTPALLSFERHFGIALTGVNIARCETFAAEHWRALSRHEFCATSRTLATEQHPKSNWESTVVTTRAPRPIQLSG